MRFFQFQSRMTSNSRFCILTIRKRCRKQYKRQIRVKMKKKKTWRLSVKTKKNSTQFIEICIYYFGLMWHTSKMKKYRCVVLNVDLFCVHTFGNETASVYFSLGGIGVTCYEETGSTGEQPIHRNCSLKHSAALLSVITQGPEGGTGSWLGTYKDRGEEKEENQQQRPAADRQPDKQHDPYIDRGTQAEPGQNEHTQLQ